MTSNRTKKAPITEAPPAPSTEAPAPAPSAEAPAPAPRPEHEVLAHHLLAGLEGGATNVTKAQEYLRTIHSSQRGKVQSQALKVAVAFGAGMAEVMAWNEAFANLPAAPASRAKVEVPADHLAYLRRLAAEAFLASLPEAPRPEGMVEPTMADILPLAATLRRTFDGTKAGTPATKAKVTGADGKVVSLADLITAGKVTAGTILTGRGDAKATVGADGTVTVGKAKGLTLSAAARTAAGTKAENGWAFWHLGDKALATLR